MTINFPDDTSQDYLAPNGVVYSYEDNRWRVKSYAGADGAEAAVGPNLPLTLQKALCGLILNVLNSMYGTWRVRTVPGCLRHL